MRDVSDKPLTCLRCLRHFATVDEQVAGCAYCRENHRRISRGDDVLEAPTTEFPINSPN